MKLRKEALRLLRIPRQHLRYEAAKASTCTVDKVNVMENFLSSTECKEKYRSYAGSKFVVPMACFAAAVVSYNDREEKQLKKVIQQADVLYEKNEVVELYDLLKVHESTSCADVMWRLARATKEFAETPDKSADEKKQLLYTALGFASKAIELDEKNFAGHKWYGILLSIVGDYEGTKKKLENMFVVKDCWVVGEHLADNKAAELCPTDATSKHLLGMWYFACAELPWYQKKIAAAIFTQPPDATYEQALECFLEAEKGNSIFRFHFCCVDPGFYSSNHLMLGKVYMRMEKKQEAKPWLERVLKTKEITDEARKNIEEAETHLKSL